MNTLRVERRVRKEGTRNGILAVVWLGKLQAGVVGFYEFDGQGPKYMPACFLPEVKAGIAQNDIPREHDDLEGAIDWVICQANRWLEKAGVEAVKSQLDQAHLANIKPLDAATRREWLDLAEWAEDYAQSMGSKYKTGPLYRVAIALPIIVRRAIDCGFEE